MNKKIYELGFFYAVAFVILVLLFFVFEPFLIPLFLAAVVASVFFPLHKRLLLYFKKKTRLAAASSLILIILLIIGPFVFVGSLLSSEALDVFQKLSSNGFLNSEFIVEKTNSFTSRILPDFIPKEISVSQVENTIRSSIAPILQNISGLFVGLFSFSFASIIFLIALYFFFKDGEELVEKAIIMSPLPDQHDKKIADNLAKAFDTVIRGSIIIALVQGILAVIGFLIAGSGAPMLLGSLAALASLIPGIGATIIVVPVGIYILVLGKYIAGIFLVLWGLFVVGLSDNILRPFLIEKGIKVHPLIILLSILGGISFMGPIGVIAGPVLISMAVALIEVHPYLLKQ